jgi:hypothetical protein
MDWSSLGMFMLDFRVVSDETGKGDFRIMAPSGNDDAKRVHRLGLFSFRISPQPPMTLSLRFVAASEGGFESLSHRWFPDRSGSKPTIIANNA